MARDTKDHAEDLDGLAKNIDKLKKSTKDVIDHVKKETAEGTHDVVMNAVTEAARKDPYWASHAFIGVVAVLVVIIGVISVVAFL